MMVGYGFFFGWWVGYGKCRHRGVELFVLSFLIILAALLYSRCCPHDRQPCVCSPLSQGGVTATLQPLPPLKTPKLSTPPVSLSSLSVSLLCLSRWLCLSLLSCLVRARARALSVMPDLRLEKARECQVSGATPNPVEKKTNCLSVLLAIDQSI